MNTDERGFFLSASVRVYQRLIKFYDNIYRNLFSWTARFHT